MTPENDTLRARVQARYPDIDPRLLQEIAGAEVLATAKSVYAAGNNNFPRWTLERWVLVFQLAATCIGAMVFFGGDWVSVKKDVTVMKDDVRDMKVNQFETQKKLDALKAQIETIELADEWYRNNPRTGPQFGRP